MTKTDNIYFSTTIISFILSLLTVEHPMDGKLGNEPVV